MKQVASFLKHYWITVLIFIGFVVGYYLIANVFNVNSFLFPDIEKIGEAFQQYWQTLFLNMFSSFELLIPAIIIAVCIALSVGSILGMNKGVRRVLYPVIYTISVIPSILLSPFALLLAPDFWHASLFLIVYETIWVTLFATITGIQTINKTYLDNAAALGLHGPKKFFKIILPAASPTILAGLVNSLRGSFVMLVYAEMYGAKYGMGYFVRKYADYGLYQDVWAGFIFMVIVLVIVMQTFEHLKNYMLKWSIDD